MGDTFDYAMPLPQRNVVASDPGYSRLLQWLCDPGALHSKILAIERHVPDALSTWRQNLLALNGMLVRTFTMVPKNQEELSKSRTSRHIE
jgi:hypothetical protein